MPIQNWKELQDTLNERQTGIVSPEDSFELGNIGVPSSYDDKLKELDAYLEGMSSKEGFLSGVKAIRNKLINNPQDYTREAAELGYGSERIDKKIPYDIWRLNPDEARAVTQTQASKLVNGAAKMIPYANTTFLDNTFGLVAGIANIAKDALDGGVFTPGQSFINTPFAQQMQEIRDFSEKMFPNFRTQEEIDDADHWWRHLNGNFWGDVFLKNLGFTIGAAGSAIVGSSAVAGLSGKAIRNAYKAALAAEGGDQAAFEAFRQVLQGGRAMGSKKIYDTLESVRKAYSRLGWESQLVGGIGGAIGESRVEALNAAKEYRDSQAVAAETEYDRAKAELLAEVMANYPDFELVYDGYGNPIDSRPTISKEGWDYYNARLADLQAKYNSTMNTVEGEADDVANHTFWFNMPLLTGSNIVMFGRMMSGGFKSQAKNMLKGKPGAYRGAGSVAGEWAKNVGRAATEGVEELSQKVFSEGSKDVANANIAAFNNGKYDTEAIKGTAQWLSSLMDSASDVASDPESWEEFAIGMLTGALSQVPGNGWRAGIDQVKANRAAAEKLNDRINQPEFKALWEGLVRHNHYENIKDAALNHTILNKNGEVERVGDQFVWHSANDAEILSDVKMFADSGRLADLEDYVDSFANLSDEDIQKISSELIDETDSDFQNKSLAQKRDWLQSRALEVKKAIHQYRDIHEALDTMSMGTSDHDVIDEMVFTQAQLQNFEDRYNKILDEVLGVVRPRLEEISREKNTEGNPTAKAERASYLLSSESGLRRLFGGAVADVVARGTQDYQETERELIEIDDAYQAEVFRMLDSLGALVEDDANKGTKQKVKDLQRLVRSRQDFYSKLFDPRFLQKFEKDKKTTESAAAEIREEAANRDTEGLNTLADIKNAYLAKPSDARDSFAQNIASSSNPNKEAFGKLLSTVSDFKNTLSGAHPNLVNKRTGGFNRITDIVLDRMFANAENADDFVNRLGTTTVSLDDVNTELSRMVEAGIINEDEALPVMVAQFYGDTINAINEVAQTFKDSWSKSSGRESIKPTPQKNEKVDDEAKPEAAAKPEAKPETKTEEKSEPVPEPQVSAPQSPEVSEPAAPVDAIEASGDTNSSYTDTTPSEDDSYRRDSKGSVKLGYYQQSVPEIPITVEAEARDLLKQRKTATKEEMEYIDQRLASLDLSDFIQFDDNGNPVGGETGYGPTYKWLKDNGAFKYIATELSVDDRVVFAVMDGVPEYKGRKQIVVGVVSNRDADGNITGVQPLTILHSIDNENNRSQYMNLNELYDAIMADYESSEPEGSLYVFGGRQNPITSRVFGIRPGIQRYDKKGDPKRIDKIDDYNPNAPIIMLDAAGNPVLLRGGADVSKFLLPNIYPWSKPHAGRLYYMVKSGDYYSPILLNRSATDEELLEPVTKENISRLIDEGQIVSNAQELRQVGANFLFDPWNGKDEFERILPSTKQEEKSMPGTGPQKVAVDAEMGESVETPVAESTPESVYVNPPSVEIVPDDLDALLGTGSEQDSIQEEMKSYEYLSKESKATLEAKGITQARWDSITNEKFRKKLLGC